MPLFVKPGTIIPKIHLEMGKTTGNANRAYGNLEFNIYPGGTEDSFSVYEDDGNSYDYL